MDIAQWDHVGARFGRAAADMPDQEIAERLAVEAGELLLQVRRESGLQGRELGDRGDATSNAYLFGRLRQLRGEDVILSEESDDDRRRLRAQRVWIVDPVDGTREYSQPPHRDWAVHVAMWDRDGDPARARLAAAAVSLPAAGVVVGTGAAPGRANASSGDSAGTGASNSSGVRLCDGNDAPLQAAGTPSALVDPRADDAIRIVASGSRPPAFLGEVVKKLGRAEVAGPAPAAAGANEPMGAELVALGSAGAKAMAVVRGEADAYVHAGGQYQWDSAAPVGVALAHGFAACRIDGSELEYNGDDVYLPDLIVCRAELRDPLVAAIAEARGSRRGAKEV